MNLIQSLIYGIVSGISSFLPVSSYGHQVLLRQIFGATYPDPLTDLFVHLSLLSAVLICYRSNLKILTRDLSANRRRTRSRAGRQDHRRTYEIRLLITAAIAMLVVLLFSSFGRKTEGNLLLVCLFFVLNGMILYVTDHLSQSNKDASQMTALDAVLMGLFGGLSIFPGLSRTGACMSLAVGRGSDKSHALNWAVMLSIPALILLALFDFAAIFTAGLTFSFVSVLGCFLAAVGAFVCGYAAMMIMRFLVVNTGFAGFACYSWGMAILTFILYLIA